MIGSGSVAQLVREKYTLNARIAGKSDFVDTVTIRRTTELPVTPGTANQAAIRGFLVTVEEMGCVAVNVSSIGVPIDSELVQNTSSASANIFVSLHHVSIRIALGITVTFKMRNSNFFTEAILLVVLACPLNDCLHCACGSASIIAKVTTESGVECN